IDFEDFMEASELRVKSPGTYVFRDYESWTTFCFEHWRSRDIRPLVDFEKYMIIAIFWGQSGGCYSWANGVKDVFIRQGVIEVHLIEPDLGYCDMIIWPLQVIKMKKYDLPIEFHGCIPGDTEKNE
ncbi:MAG: hypothetical protein JSW64_00995, partial [Candidatus Zixiibacteriota bacterium]